MNKLFHPFSLFLLSSVIVAGVVMYWQHSENSAAGESGRAQSPAMQLAVEKGCNACHSFDGSTGIGPTWKGTYGTLRIMTDGSQHLADDAYLRKSMLEPAAEVVTGFENIMLPPELTETEITQLMLLIRELGTTGPG
ncbi:MAG: hypothetical protein V4628_05710 [Pseudomonadota bacterium]